MKIVVNYHLLVCEDKKRILTFDHIFYNIFYHKNDIAIISDVERRE
jgi:hypothetical protein